MGKRLSDNLNSLYIGAANSLRPKQARRRIIAYVESYDDVAFWRTVLGSFEDAQTRFEVMLPSRSSLSKGKKMALMNDLGCRLGQNMIACVDSDYDYLLQGATQTSRTLNESPYVLQTYAYAIENFQCYAPALHEVCVQATLNDRPVIDFPAFLRLYSEIVYPLFVWNIWFYRRHQLREFSMTDFCSVTRLEQISVYHPERALEGIRRKVNRRLSELEHLHPEGLLDVERLKEELRQLGVYPSNTYLFIQGHHLMDSVVIKLLTPVCVLLRREREDEIKQLAEHDMQLNNELTAYQHRQSSVEEIIHRHTGYKDSELYKKIETDIRKLLKRV
jgi:hypothetical protein